MLTGKLHCMACGSRNVRLVFAYLKRVDGLMQGKFQIRCGECGVHQTGRITGTRKGTNILRMVRARKAVA